MHQKHVRIAKCIVCKAEVDYRVNASGKVYYYCNGQHDNKACGSNVVFGKKFSDDLLQTVKPTPETTPKPAATPSPQPKPEGPSDDGRKPDFQPFEW